MASFLSNNFLLNTNTAKELYHGFAAGMPVLDYHSHLPPDEIAQNRQFETITELWLNGDHYKWRAMRALGMDEKYITGKASGREKFRKWAEAVPQTAGNPLFHWTHMELKKYFGITELLTPENCDRIYERCNELLATPEYSARGLLKKMNVELVCTTDDPCDDLEHHKKLKKEFPEVQVLPTFRPDRVNSFSDPAAWNRYIDRLGECTGQDIATHEKLLKALEKRVNYFDKAGCILSDHGLAKLPDYQEGQNLDAIFSNLRKGNPVSRKEQDALAFHILVNLGRLYHKQGWAQQFHLGAIRNTNTRLLEKLGPDTGFDSIGDYPQGEELKTYLDALDSTDQLPKTILYNLNPADNALFATMAGNYNDGSIRGKMQYGPAWWFLDQKNCIEEQLKTVAGLGLLSTFIGMLTDSRSFLSYSRHEYFRRILCNLIGDFVKNGELPNDTEWLGKLIADICYHNAKQYFNL